MTSPLRCPRAHRLLWVWLLVAMGVAAGTGCNPRAGGVDSTSPIVLVVIDTLRRDHLGTYGYGRDTSPVIDELGRRGMVFERAVAQAPWTLPSLASLLTSRHPPSALQARGGTLPRLAGEATTLAEVLHAAGYHTVGVTTNPYNADAFNLMQGFDDLAWKLSASAEWVVDQAIAAADGNEGRPLFLYLHFMDAHEPRNPPRPYDSMFPTVDGRNHHPSHRRFVRYSDGSDVSSPGFVAHRSHSLALYDGSIRFIDDQLGRLLERLEEDDALVAITSDHGEEFWDHAELGRELGLPAYSAASKYGVGHGHTLFPELIDVPLILAGPGVPKGAVTTQVRLLDLAPTLAELAGTEMKQASGVALVGRWRADSLSDLPALAETRTPWALHQSLVTSDFQLLRVQDRTLLFPRPGRLRDVTGSETARAQRLDAELDLALARAIRPPVEPLELDAQTRDRLRALGYHR